MVASVRTEGYGGSRHPFTIADLRLVRNQLKVKKKLTWGQKEVGLTTIWWCNLRASIKSVSLRLTSLQLDGNTYLASCFGHKINLSHRRVFISVQIIWFLTCKPIHACKYERRDCAGMLQRHNHVRLCQYCTCQTLRGAKLVKTNMRHLVSEVSAVSNRNFLRLLVQTRVTVCWSRPT